MHRRTVIKGLVSSLVPIAGFARPALSQGRKVKIGYVRPETGSLSGFASADAFILENFAAAAAAKGLDIQLIPKDSQSNPNRAAVVANELIVDQKVHMIVVGAAPETNNPVATICESEGIPCLSTLSPWQPWFIGRQSHPADPKSWRPFEYGYHFFWGLEDVIAAYAAMWAQLDTSKKLGFLFANDADGNAWADSATGFPPAAKKLGYRPLDLGRYQTLTDDFSTYINSFRAEGVDIVTGTMIPPDFTTFWTQASQKGFKPRIVTIGKALLFPQTVEAIGPAAQNLSCEVWWAPSFPFASSLNGASASDFAKDYTARTGRPWTQVIGFIHALLEVAADAVKRASDPTNPDRLKDALAATRLDTIVGPVGWQDRRVPDVARRNVCKTPVVGGQWRRQDDGGFDLMVVDNAAAPNIPVGGRMEAVR